jgi:hypothetical protein
MNSIDVFTISSTKKSVENFFGKLIKVGTTRVIDVRLYSTFHLAGFTKKALLGFPLFFDLGFVNRLYPLKRRIACFRW